MRKQLRYNLLLQFSIVSFVAMLIVATALYLSLSRAAREQIMEEAAEEARDSLLLRITPRLTPEDLAGGMTGERYDQFHRFVQESVVSARTARVKIWNRQGMVVYSTDPSQVGQTFPVKPSLQQALAGGVGRSISVPQAAENERERLLGTLVEVYVPLRLAGSVVPDGSLEIYQYYAPYDYFIKRQQRLVFLVVFVGFLVLYLALVFLVARGWQLITRQRQQLERGRREVIALNQLLMGHLEQRQRVLDGIQRLSQEISSGPPATLHEWEQRRERIVKLAQEAASFPLPPGGRSPLSEVEGRAQQP